MSQRHKLFLACAATAVAGMALLTTRTDAQAPNARNDGPNPYRTVEGWAKLPEGRTWGSTHTNLRMESRFDSRLIDQLMSSGHDVHVLDEPYSDTMGHAGAVILHADGTLEAGHDPRADGGAAGV